MEVLGGGSSVLNDTALHLGQALLNITAKQPQQQQDILYITDNRVTDSQLTTSLWLNALLGFIFFCLFCILQRTVFPQHYRFRLVSKSVTVKPRNLPTRGLYSLWAWLWTAWTVNEDEIMRSSGLDAVVMIKALQMGVEIFTPLALVGCAVLLPVHYQFKGKDTATGFNRSQLMQLTIAALPRGSNVMWLHFALTICYNFWVMWVLARYFKDFVLVRQHYLSKGDDPNYWMWVTREAHAEYMTKKVRKLLAEVNEPGSNEPSGGGGQQPPPPEVCTSPQPTERASTSTGRPGWLGSVTDKMSRLAQRMSRTNLFSRSSDSYKPYTNEVSPHNSPAALSPDGSEHRMAIHGQWLHSAGTLRMTAAGLASSSVGSDGSVGNSKDSLDGNGSGHGTAAGSESGGSNAGGVVSGGGKRWSSGSSSGAGTGALGSSEGGSVATGSSRGGADNSSGSESSGGGATAAIDSIGRRLRLSGSRGSKGSGRGSGQQAASNLAAAAGGAGPGTPPTYQTISELHSMTQAASSGFPGHFWPPVPKHMRTITEDSLEYRLDASLGASRPSSRGGLAGGTVNGTRNSSSSGTDLSPCAAAARNAHTAALAAAAQGAGCSSLTGFLSTEGSGSSAQALLLGAGPSGSSGAAGPSSLSRSSTTTATLSAPGPAAAVSAAAAASSSSSSNPQPLLGVAGSAAAAGEDAAAAAAAVSRAPSLAGGCPAHHAASRDTAQLRASITSLDSIDERSSVGTCIIYNSVPSSPGREGCSISSSRPESPLPDDPGADSSGHGSGGQPHFRDISFAGGSGGGYGGVALQGTFAEAAMAAGSSSSGGSSSSRSSSGGGEQVVVRIEPAASSGSSGQQQQLKGDQEATLQPVSQEEVAITVLDDPRAAPAAVGSGSRVAKGHRKHRRGHGHESSVDFSKQHLPDLSHMDVSLLDAEAQDGPGQHASSMQGRQATAGSPARWSPFANSDGIASSIAAAGVALVADGEPWGTAATTAAAEIRAGKPAAPAAISGRAHHRASATLKQQAIQLAHVGMQLTHAGQPQKQQPEPLPQSGPRQSAFAQAAQQAQQPSPRQEQQQQQQGQQQQQQLGKVSLRSGSQHSLSRSQQNSSNGSTTTSTSSRQQRHRVQQPSLHSSSEPSPVSQGGIPPCWSASWQHQQQQAQAQAQLRPGVPQGNPSSSNTSRAMSPVERSFLTLQTQAVAGAAVGAGQELTPAALAAAAVAAGGGGTMADAAAERLQQMLQEGLDLQGPRSGRDELDRGPGEWRVAYHWWKDLPAEQLRKCDSLASDQQTWMDVRADEPLLAKPSVRFRKTINTHGFGPDGKYKRIAVNAQHYAVLVTDVQPRCPYPEMEGESNFDKSALNRALTWLGYWVDRLTPRTRWGAGAYKRYSGDHALPSDSWPYSNELHHLRISQEDRIQLLGMQLGMQQQAPSRLSLEALYAGMGPGVSAGGVAGTPCGQMRSLRRHSTMASCQTSTEGLLGAAGLPSSAGTAAPGGAGGPNPLARLSQGSHLSHLSLLPEGRPEDQMQYLQQQIQWAMNKLNQDVAAGVLHPKDKERRMAKILKVQADFQDKLAASERMATISRETCILLPAGGRTTNHMRMPLSALPASGLHSTAGTPGMVSRCSSFKSVGPRGPGRGHDSAVAGAAVGNPDFASSKAAGTCGSATPYSLQPTPRSPTPLSVREVGAAPGSARERVDPAAASALATHHHVPMQHRLPPTLISSSSLQQRLQRMRVGASARMLGGNAGGLESGDLPLHMFNSASGDCLLRAQISTSAGGQQQPAVLEGHASAPVGMGPGAAEAVPAGHDAAEAAAAAGQQLLADGQGGGNSSTLAARRAGGPAMLTPQMSGELFTQPQQQQHRPGSQQAAADDQPTPAAEWAALPPRYSRQQQQRSPPVSPRQPVADGPPSSSTHNSDSTNTPATEGRRDSFDSATSQPSGGAFRRPVVHFSRPCPPDSPRAAAAASGPGLSPRSPRSLTSQGSGSRAISGVITHGAAGRTLRPAAGAGSGRLLPAASAGGSSTGSLPPFGQVHGAGSSGGGAGAGSSGGGAPLHPMPPLPSRGRSGRSFDRQHSSQHVPSADHLAVVIPPCPQGPPSRSGTPGTAAPGAVSLMAHPSISHLSVPPQPWGLPPDAALLNTSFGSSPLGPWGSGSKAAFRAATTGGIVGVPVQPQQSFNRWSAGGVAEQRSFTRPAGQVASGHGNSRVTSPLLSDQEGPAAGAAAAAGADGSVLLPGQSRPASSTETAAIAAAIDDDTLVGELGPADNTFFGPVCNSHGFLLPPAHMEHGWGRVKWAIRTKELFDLPRRESYDVVSATFKRLFPDEFDRAIPVIKHRGVDKLLLQWEAAVAALERAELKKQRTGREPLRLTGACGPLLGCCAESIGCGCCPCGMSCMPHPGSTCLPEGCTVKIIPELQDTIQSLEAEIEQARRTAFSSAFTPSWFVLFKTQSAAMMAASTRIYAHDNTKFQVHPAPGPEEVNWQHVWMSGFERDLRTAFTWPLTLLLVLFPITLVTSAASRLEYVFCPHTVGGGDSNTFYWRWYCSGREQGSSLQSFMRAFITGWLPSLLLNLWLAMVMPRLVYLIVQMEGSCFSLSALERRIGAIFFYWDVYNMFLQGTIGSTFFQQVHSIIQSPEKLPTILGAALPDSSNFFMQFIAMRALFLIWLRLCVPHGGVWQNWLHYCCCPRVCCSTCNTDRDRSLTYGPRTPRYGFEMGHMLLMYLIAMAFSIVSPLLLPFSVVWFAFAWLAWRHNLSYVYQRKYESGGMMWIFLFSRIIMCLVIGQLFTFCVLVVRGAYWQAFLIIAFMPALTLRYYRYCQARYARGVEYGVPLDVANKAPPAQVPALAYIPPPLQDRSWGWYPEWQKIWEGWGMPTYAAA